MNKKLVIGLGTGRCGTVSLTHLLDSQLDAYMTHERPFLLPWKFDQQLADKKLEQLTATQKNIAGDVAYYYLSYVKYFMESDVDVSFICLKRDKYETVQSYLRKTKGRNHWMNHDGTVWQKDPNYDPTYPSFLATDKEQALNFYHDEYYSLAENLQEKYPNNFKIFNTDDLNSEDSVRQILNFIGIDENDQQVLSSIKRNVAGIDSRESQ